MATVKATVTGKSKIRGLSPVGTTLELKGDRLLIRNSNVFLDDVHILSIVNYGRSFIGDGASYDCLEISYA